MVTQIYKIRSEIWVAPSLEIWRPQNINISALFRTTSRLDRECLRNATRHRQLENGVASYGHCCTGKLNLLYFGPQTVKNKTGVLTHPTGGHHAGLCHASSFNYFYACATVRWCRRYYVFMSSVCPCLSVCASVCNLAWTISMVCIDLFFTKLCQ